MTSGDLSGFPFFTSYVLYASSTGTSFPPIVLVFDPDEVLSAAADMANFSLTAVTCGTDSRRTTLLAVWDSILSFVGRPWTLLWGTWTI